MRGRQCEATRQRRTWPTGCALVFFALLALPALAATPATDTPETIRRLIDAGAAQLALTRIEALQPADPKAPRWAEWETMRCEVLARLKRPDALLARGALLPPDGVPVPRACLIEGARAAASQNEPRLARTYAAQLLWQGKPAAGEIRAARLAVIESYVAERRGEDAYRSMLRFHQDYAPLDRAVAARFAEALLDLDLEREALNWLGPSDEVSPTRLRLQLRSAGLTPEAVSAQARAAYAKTQDPAYWRVMLEAALRRKNHALEIEARERLLQQSAGGNPQPAAESAERLWQAYLTTAEEIGNRQRLLVGDDAAWADHAARRLGPDPFLSRAFYAYLARRAANPDIRRNAQLALAFSLYQAKLDHTALRVMQQIGAPFDTLDAQTRYLLGTIAANRNEPKLALELWEGLKTPASLKPEDWQVTIARTALQAGDSETSVNTVKRLLIGPVRLPPELAKSALELAQEMLDLRKLEHAQALYEAIARVAADAAARDAFFGLGRVHELKGEALAAAEAYLRAGLPPGAPDAIGFQARLLAGINLMRAGMKDDARAQFEWLVKNSKDPALVDAARRGLARL
ncbi:MAG: hypothetical protein ACXWUS_14450 [Burkholderiales bacterium]